MATTSVHHLQSFPTSFKSTPKRSFKRSIANSVRCCTTATTETPRVTVQKGNDSLDICRVLNGMWQTSGGWGRIDGDDAVEAMLRYADNGLSTFDMADHYLLRLHCHCYNSSKFSSVKCSPKTKTKRIRPRTAIECVLTEDNQRTLVNKGKDCLDICRVVNGMWQTSGGWGRIERDSAVDAMLKYADAGLNTFDMADIYGPAEDLYGIFINRVRRERPPEFLDKVRGLTKWVPPPVKMTSNYVRENINVSRKRMDVTSLDMLQFHWWDYSNSGYLDALKHLTDLKEEGKIKTIALTNFDTERLQIILENEIPVVSNQVQHSIVDMRPQQKMAELCQLTGVKLITYGTVMGGLLSEKFLDTNISIPFVGPSLNTPSLQKYKRMVDAWGGWSLFQALLQTLKRVASKHGVSIPAVAVKYILDQPAVAGSMIGVRLGLSDHIEDSLAVFSLALDEEDINSIQEVSSKGKDLLRIIGDCGDEYRRA